MKLSAPPATLGFAALTSLVLFASSPGTAHARGREGSLEAGVFVGANRLGSNIELGNSAYSDQVPGDSFLGGFRTSYAPFDRLGIEMELKYAMARTAGDTMSGREPVPGSVLGFRMQALIDLTAGKHLRPFLLVGAGAETLRVDAPSDYRVATTDTDEEAHWGLGARYALSKHFGLRVDARQTVTAGRSSRFAVTYEAQAGLFFTFGGAPPPRPSRAKEPEVAKAALPIVDESAVEETPEPEQEEPVVEEPVEAPANTSPEEAVLAEIRAGIQQIEFKKGSARLVGSSKRRLQAIATLLLDHNWVQVDIVGHTDSTGKARDNLALSRKRADYVKWFLVDQGVDTDRIHAWGEADRKPLDKRPRKASNRRVEFAIE